MHPSFPTHKLIYNFWGCRQFEPRLKYQGNLIVSNNNPRDQTSILTCVKGSPAEGVWCSMGGDGSNRDEVLVVAKKKEPWEDWFLVKRGGNAISG
jgi:hypothetical protein